MNVRAADSVGIEIRKTLHMENTNSPRRAAFCRASICPIDKSIKLQAPSVRRYVTLTQDVVVWLLGYSLKKNVDNLHYFVLFNNGPWYNVILTIKKEKDEKYN